FFFDDSAYYVIYTLSLHDALPICLDSLEFLDNFFHLELVFYDNTHFQILILLELGMYYKILLEVIETNDCLLVQVKLPLYFSLVIQVADHLYYILLLIHLVFPLAYTLYFDMVPF